MNKMKQLLFVKILIIASLYSLTAQTTKQVDVNFSGRIDSIPRPEIAPIMRLWVNYLNSRPDSIYDNPYWNSDEKNKYKDFDFSRVNIFQGGYKSYEVFNYWKPYVLTIEPVGKKYSIRTIFIADTVKGEASGSKVWCSLIVYAKKEKDKWVLENAIYEVTRTWKHSQYGYIDYIYPPEYRFNKYNAQKSIYFCDSIIQKFSFAPPEPFKYYVTNSQDEMGMLEGFEFYFAGCTTGKGREHMLLSGNGNEYYPHELIHLIVPKNAERNWMINEGFAVWLGDSKADSVKYNKSLSVFANDFCVSDTIDFKTVLNKKLPWNYYNPDYPAGAILCIIVYDRKGVKGINALLSSDTKTNENFIKELENILEVNETEFLRIFRDEVLKWRKLK
jgi:hypothetical protein